MKKYQTLEEALEGLIAHLGPNSLEELKEFKTADNFTASVHFSYGMQLRNSLGLWEPHTQNELVKWFWDNLKLTHADDMSAIICTAMWHRVNEQPYTEEDMLKQAESYHKHWFDTMVGP